MSFVVTLYDCKNIFLYIGVFNSLMPSGNKKVTHTETNLQLNAQRSAAGLFKHV